MKTSDLLPIGEVVARSGFAASALRFYDAEGLIHSERSAGGQRRFARNTLRRLAFIRAATNVGLTLEEVRAELDSLPDGRTPNKRDWTRISEHWRHRLDEQIEALQALRTSLDSCIGCGCLSLRQCGFSNPQDAAARADGPPGAAFLPEQLRQP